MKAVFLQLHSLHLLKFVTSIEEGTNYNTYHGSEYVNKNKEHYLPSGISLYENVQQLTPNHYVDVNEGKPKRFWPDKKHSNIDLDAAQKKISRLLQDTMRIAASKFALAVPIYGRASIQDSF